jgi:hypothetical protein
VRVGIDVVVGVGMAVIVEVGSGEGTPVTTGWFVAMVVTWLPGGEGCVTHPVTRMKKITDTTRSRGIFIR